MLLSFLLNIHSHYSATISRPSSWLYQARLTWALCFGLWFRSKCCQHANNHLYSIYTWNDLMLLSFLLNIHSHYSATISRPSSWVYQARLTWSLCFGLWFRSKCCQHSHDLPKLVLLSSELVHAASLKQSLANIDVLNVLRFILRHRIQKHWIQDRIRIHWKQEDRIHRIHWK